MNLTKQERDILEVLYKSKHDLFSKGDIPLSARLLSENINVDRSCVKDLCERLLEKKMVKLVDAGGDFYMITPKGERKHEGCDE